MSIKTGRYVHFKGKEYEVIDIATHSETQEEMVVYRALYGESGLWVRPASMWDELVEYNGKAVKRFTHVDEIALNEPPLDTTFPTVVHKRSSSSDKINLFLSLFTGREDVFAKRWENIGKSKSGYSPVCGIEWKPLCPKSGGGKKQCGSCPNQAFVTFDAKAVENHLLGKITAGVYPMLPDETCRFLAFDFDGKDCSPVELRRDVSAIREVCAEKGITLAMERSRSGKGIHLWAFFAENVPASIARKFGSGLITCAMNKHHGLTFKTYDRLIPSQDTLPKGGFGNLIALPLQKAPRENGNSVFVDEDFNAYTDQWNYLSGVRKYSLTEIESFIKELAPSGELGILHRDSESDDGKPWEAKKQQRKLTKMDFPETVNIVRANMLHIEKSGISSPALNTLKRLAAFPNPEFYKAQAMRLSTYNKARIISCFDETEKYISLPRGLESDVSELLESIGVNAAFVDETNKGRSIDVAFKGELRGEQNEAAAALLAYDNGILSATTAFGKTVIGAYLMAQRKTNTLILVHRTNLLTQWVDRLNDFLTINEEPITELTPTGREKGKYIIGQIGGGKNNLSDIIDVAVMQSLVSGEEVKELVQGYGMVIVDECHHVSAFSFEQILKTVNAKYVYGLTATPTRRDGHHPIIYMHCGKIRYKVDAKKQAEERPFNHFIIPRFTRFQKPVHREADWKISDIYADIVKSGIRNSLIIEDIVAAVNSGRNPIILTERTDHVQVLTEMLGPRLKNVIALTGGSTQKQSRDVLRKVADIPADEPFALVATGKYIGEGFDMPRLDTLFLAMPISWKGTVQQYAGRLHRLFEGKEEVQVYDYVDVHVTMLEKMYQKRLKSYASIGYKAKGNTQPIEEVHCIYDNHDFFPVYSADVLAAKSEVLIVSPFLTKRRVLHALNYILSADASITIVTKPPDNYNDKDKAKIEDCIELLSGHEKITVKTKNRIHQKYAIMDQRTVWYGSINLLSYGSSEESIMRIESADIAGELLRGL